MFDEYRKIFKINKIFNDLNEKMGYKRYPGDLNLPPTKHKILTVHAYPEELNYPGIRAKNWFNLEIFNLNRNVQMVELNQLLPAEFLANTLDGNFSGKFIYLSLGSMVSVDVDLMKRLVEILGKTNHKYIVSKGPRHTEYDLADNMWGDRYLPQTKLIPHVDLVITHGGNNTVTETFIEAKPMLVLPAFADQFDNAQRLTETGFGAKIDTNNFTSDQLTETINRLLSDEKLKLRLEQAAKRIHATDRHEQLAQKIEQLLGLE